MFKKSTAGDAAGGPGPEKPQKRTIKIGERHSVFFEDLANLEQGISRQLMIHMDRSRAHWDLVLKAYGIDKAQSPNWRYNHKTGEIEEL